MTDDKLYESLPANTIMAKLTNHVQRTNFITSTSDKYYSLDSEDDFRSGCRNVSHHQQFFLELPSSGRSHNTIYWYFWVQTISYKMLFSRPMMQFLSLDTAYSDTMLALSIWSLGALVRLTYGKSISLTKRNNKPENFLTYAVILIMLSNFSFFWNSGSLLLTPSWIPTLSCMLSSNTNPLWTNKSALERSP